MDTDVQRHYILDGTKPVLVDLMTWAKWSQTAGEARHVARSEISNECHVSTVFLGTDHGWMYPNDPPVLFETLVFGGPLDEEMDRYCTWTEAEQGHQAMVDRCKQAQ